MALETFELEIATPERLLVQERVSEAEIPCASGQIGVLAGHAPLLSELGIGELTYLVEGKKHSIAIAGGVVEVQPEYVRVLAMTAERPEDIDTSRAQAALKRAMERLETIKENIDYARALNAAKRAQARLRVAASLRF
ncbi:MAG: F0F1 ATP synthase subunit epsilon [Bryobacteraceae bacterium]|nr:F0F1 ATP synthase subunit epsilon [Bryobacteraceae bacterium]MDW8378792.1 F0F1 ATP synthase subunit epsilon [Bryobacterales bacterium]